MSLARNNTRTVLFFSLLLWTWGGPFAKQVLHRRWPYAQHWVMFSGASLDVCAVRFTERAEDGTETPVDRWETTDTDRWDVTRNERVIRDAAAATAAGRRLCRSVPRGTDLRVYARCATRTGWSRVVKGESNVCSK